VVDGNVITGKGPGSCMEFSLRLVSALYSKEKADEVARPMALCEGRDY
jgi:4-methyl-5(b-hydroxyethyl)-thiazole monophosphate biosynthesis